MAKTGTKIRAGDTAGSGAAFAGEGGAKLHILRTESLTTVVQYEIERLILTGQLPAGERINENLLATNLSVSRGPVREACRKLEQAGLLEIVVNRGVFVRKLELDEVLDLYDVRAALAELAGRLLAPRLDATGITRLADLVGRMEEAIEDGGLDAYYPLNVAFHNQLMVATGNRRLADTYNGMDKEMRVFRRRSLVSRAGLRQSNSEHKAIVEALLGGDAERVGGAMKHHIQGGRARLERSVGGTRPATKGRAGKP